MPDANYAVVATASNENNLVGINDSPPAIATTHVDLRIWDAGNSPQELTNGVLCVTVVR